jgi:hypothetical protein
MFQPCQANFLKIAKTQFSSPKGLAQQQARTCFGLCSLRARKTYGGERPLTCITGLTRYGRFAAKRNS